MRRKTFGWTACGLALAVAGACSSPTGTAKQAPPPTVTPATPQAAERGLVKAVALSDIDGHTVKAASAEQPTVLIFFASWCQPCRNELEILSAIRAEQPDVRVLGINAYEEYSDFSDEQRLRGFLAVNAPWLQVVRADSGLMKTFGGVPKIPTLFVYSGDGSIVQEFRREMVAKPPSKAELEAALTAAKARATTAAN